jgi:hypothetical protein
VRNNNKYKLLDDLDKKVAINKKMTALELEEEKLRTKWVLYENYICDVGPFISSHPGGRNLISDNLYSDVGRYLTGTQGYSKNIGAYNHNQATIQYMMLKLSYAQLIQNNILVSNLNYKSNMLNSDLKISSVKEIAKDTFEYKFIPDNYQFAKFLPGHTWIGRHFTIANANIVKTRYYSLCLSLEEIYRIKFNNMLDNLVDENSKNPDVEMRQEERISKHISFYIKLYQNSCFSKTLSSYVHDIYNSEFTLKGPFVSFAHNSRVLV